MKDNPMQWFIIFSGRSVGGHGPLEKLVKDMAIDTPVLSALQPVCFSTWRQSQVQQKTESFSLPNKIPSFYALADRTGTHQILLAGLWFLRVTSRAQGLCNSTIVSVQEQWAWHTVARVPKWWQQGLVLAMPCLAGVLHELIVQHCILSLIPSNSFQFIKFISVVCYQEL